MRDHFFVADLYTDWESTSAPYIVYVSFGFLQQACHFHIYKLIFFLCHTFQLFTVENTKILYILDKIYIGLIPRQIWSFEIWLAKQLNTYNYLYAWVYNIIYLEH